MRHSYLFNIDCVFDSSVVDVGQTLNLQEKLCSNELNLTLVTRSSLSKIVPSNKRRLDNFRRRQGVLPNFPHQRNRKITWLSRKPTNLRSLLNKLRKAKNFSAQSPLVCIFQPAYFFCTCS